MPKRILIADDHALILEGLRRLLADEFEVVGTASDGWELLAAAERLKPDLIGIDVAMPAMNGIEAARRLRGILPRVKIVMITQQLDPAYIRSAFAAGADAYVAKQSAWTELAVAIHKVFAGGYYVTPLASIDIPEIVRPNRKKPSSDPSEMFGANLTTRQREVLQLIAEGKSSKEISSALNISVKTVEFHRNALMDELGVRTIAELTRFAVSRGIVTS